MNRIVLMFSSFLLAFAQPDVKDVPTLYYSTGSKIEALPILENVTDMKNPVMVVNAERNELFFGIDIIGGNRKEIMFTSGQQSPRSTKTNATGVYQAKLPFGPRHQITRKLWLRRPPHNFNDIAVDWLGGNFYLTEWSGKRILACTMDGRHCTTLLNGLGLVHRVVVRPRERKIYWAQSSITSDRNGIYEADMDGGQVRWFIKDEGMMASQDLALDESEGRLYWLDAFYGTISYHDFDTGKQHLVLHGDFLTARFPYAITVYGRNVFWVDWGTDTIEACDKDHCQRSVTIAKRGALQQTHFLALAVYHPDQPVQSSQDLQDNPCLSQPCSHLCLLRPTTEQDRSGFSCRCPDHLTLATDQRTCIDNRNPA